MASSNIKLFDENKGNMLSDSEFSISNQRMNGLQTGVASSQLQNKAMYQASLVAYAIAQVMMQNGKNANDTDAVSAFVANLSGTMLQKVYDIATTEEAKAGVATGKWMSPALVKAAIDKTLTDKNYLQKSGGTMTGNLILNANPTANLGAATKQYVDTAKNACLLKSGGTMTGNLILNANPTANLGAATKQYVDNKITTLENSVNTKMNGTLLKKLTNSDLSAITSSNKNISLFNGNTFFSNGYTKVRTRLVNFSMTLKNGWSSEGQVQVQIGSFNFLDTVKADTTVSLSFADSSFVLNVSCVGANKEVYAAASTNGYSYFKNTIDMSKLTTYDNSGRFTYSLSGTVEVYGVK